MIDSLIPSTIYRYCDKKTAVDLLKARLPIHHDIFGECGLIYSVASEVTNNRLHLRTTSLRPLDFYE